jgi:hypothetical protein
MHCHWIPIVYLPSYHIFSISLILSSLISLLLKQVIVCVLSANTINQSCQERECSHVDHIGDLRTRVAIFISLSFRGQFRQL